MEHSFSLIEETECIPLMMRCLIMGNFVLSVFRKANKWRYILEAQRKQMNIGRKN